MAIRKPLIVGAMVAALFTGGTGLANAAGPLPTPWDSHSAPTGHPWDNSVQTGHDWSGSVPSGHIHNDSAPTGYPGTGSAPDGYHDNSAPTGHHEGG